MDKLFNIFLNFWTFSKTMKEFLTIFWINEGVVCASRPRDVNAKPNSKQTIIRSCCYRERHNCILLLLSYQVKTQYLQMCNIVYTSKERWTITSVICNNVATRFMRLLVLPVFDQIMSNMNSWFIPFRYYQTIFRIKTSLMLCASDNCCFIL